MKDIIKVAAQTIIFLIILAAVSIIIFIILFNIFYTMCWAL